MTESHPVFDTFIFDLDGTILDTMPDLIHVTNETLAHFGYPHAHRCRYPQLRRRRSATLDLPRFARRNPRRRVRRGA